MRESEVEPVPGTMPGGRDLPPLARVARALSAAVTVTEVVQRVVQSVLEITRADGAYVEQVVSPEGTVEVVAVEGRGVPSVGVRVPYPGSLTEEALEQGEPLALNRVDVIGKSIAPYLAKSCDGCSALVAPLISSGVLLGSLVLLRRPGQSPFDRGDVVNARIVGDLASVSLRRVVLLEETERERREKTALLESTGEGIYGINTEGRCTFINASGARMIGYGREEVIGRNMHQLIHHSHPDGTPYPEVECPIFRASREGEGARVDDEVLWRRDGSSFPVQYSSFPVVDGGARTGAVVTFTDITERRRAEEERDALLAREREARAQAETAVRIRDEVLGIVSHDLRNPLNTITLSSGLLLETPLPEPLRTKQLQIIQRAGERMNRLIQDLLDVSRLEAGRLSIDAYPQRLEPLVREACEAHRREADQHSLELTCEVEPELPLVRADRDRVLQVLGNLVGNALKFTRSGGSIRVRAERDGDAVRVSVRDTGIGIREEDLPCLFDAYWQATRTAHLGAGLGLSISKGIVEAHGGKIGVESQPGVGSTFWFILPVLGPDAQGE